MALPHACYFTLFLFCRIVKQIRRLRPTLQTLTILPQPVQILEKPRFQNFRMVSDLPPPLNTYWSPPSGSQLRDSQRQLTINTFGSNSPIRAIPSASGLTSSDFVERDDSSLHHHPLADHALESPILHSLLSSSTDIYDNPPPSYWLDNDGEATSGAATP